jgi:hypothetical protein
VADYSKMTDEAFDEFLNDATLAVRDIWEKASGDKMRETEIYALNDVLTAFFNDKKENCHG